MKIRTRKVGDLKEGGQYIFREIDDFEFVNPIQHIMDMFIGYSMSFKRDLLTMNGASAPKEIMEEVLFKIAKKEWKNELEKYKSIILPQNLLSILESDKKKEQISLLKGISLTSDELTAFIFKAYEDYGYTYSQYKASHNHEGLDENLLPELIYIDDNDNVKTIGETKLTDGQQRQVVEHRHVTVSKFLDNGNKWHCFFLTFKSMRGEEQYKQPHLHYISNAWNISRQDVKDQLTRKKYSLPSLPHVDFHTNEKP